MQVLLSNKKMKKSIIKFLPILVMIGLVSCSSSSNPTGSLALGGKEYPAIFVESGYYFDKASLSETVLADQLSKVKEITKPANLGNIELADLKTIELTKMVDVNADDAMIEAELEMEVDGEITYSPIKEKRAAKLKDKAIIDFKGFINGVEFEGGSMEDYPLILGSGQFIPGFEDQVVGHSAGKRFRINLIFPDNYDPSFAGKPVEFEIVIKSIEEPILPEVNEEFVKRHTRTGSTTVEQYKEEVKNRILARYEFVSNQLLIQQLFNSLFEKSKFEPTEEALAWQFSQIINQLNKSVEQNGLNLMTYATQRNQTMRALFEEKKSEAAMAIKQTMLFDEMKKRYGKEPKETEVMTWFDNMAEANGWGKEVTYQDFIKEAGYDNIKNEVEIENALIAATKECKLVDGETEK